MVLAFGDLIAEIGWELVKADPIKLFERLSLRLWLITAGYHVVRFALIGAAFGLLG